MEVITSLSNPKIKEISKLRAKKYREKSGLFLAEGKHLYEEALHAGVLEQVVVREKSGILLKEGNVLYVTDEVMKKLSDTVSLLDVLSVCAMPKAKEISSNKVVMLDGVQDPGNIGTIIRTALSFGYKDLVLSENTVDIYNEKVVRSTQGAVFEINAVRCDLKEMIAKLKEKNYRIYGTALRNAKPLEEFRKEEKVALIFGNEGNGIREEILKETDGNIFIEMETFESLNVAVAAGICMYHFR